MRTAAAHRRGRASGARRSPSRRARPGAARGGGGGGGASGARARARPASPATGRRSPREGGAATLAVGLTEPNPLLVWSPRAARRPALRALARGGGPHPPGLLPHRDRLGVAPARGGGAARPRHPNPGCNRAGPACGGYDGAPRAAAGARVSPARGRLGGGGGGHRGAGWAAGPPAGCERRGTEPRSRTPQPAALPAYERLVRAVLAEARAQGAELRWWSAWNEPNRYLTLSPQRARLPPRAPSVAADRYAGLVRALRSALDAAPGAQDYIVGDLAGVVRGDLGATTVREFVRDLPAELVCGDDRAGPARLRGEPRIPCRAPWRRCARRDCPRPHTVWITQTGALAAPERRARGPLPGAPGRAAALVPGPVRLGRLPVHGARGRRCSRWAWWTRTSPARSPPWACGRRGAGRRGRARQ